MLYGWQLMFASGSDGESVHYANNVAGRRRISLFTPASDGHSSLTWKTERGAVPSFTGNPSSGIPTFVVTTVQPSCSVPIWAIFFGAGMAVGSFLKRRTP